MTWDFPHPPNRANYTIERDLVLGGGGRGCERKILWGYSRVRVGVIQLVSRHLLDARSGFTLT